MIVYLHGFASGPSSQKARFFRKRFREQGVELEIPDLAEGDFERLTITGQLAVLEKLADGREISLMGSSMGGYLAALYAAKYPVRKLALLAPAFGFARRWAETMGRDQTEQWQRTGFIELYHYGDRRQRRLGYQLFEDALRYPDYPDFSQPALIFHGRRDTVVPHAYSVQFAASHSNAKLFLVDSGHELLDALDTIWAETRGFLLP